MKGTNGRIDIDSVIAYIHGRIEKEIESFAASIGIPSVTLAARVAALLSPEREGHFHNVSVMRVETSTNSRAVEPLALADGTHGNETQHGIISSTSKVAKGNVGSNRWKNHKKLTPKQKFKKQKIYQARFEAKRKGLPLPPLP